MLKKILATALAAAMVFGLASVAFAAPAFPDVAGDTYEADIARIKALGLIDGDPDGNFRPLATINRAEFTKMVVNMLGLKSAASYLATPTIFPDVKSEFSWAYGYINVATARGLVKGYEDGTFRPTNPVTQGEAITILLRALGYTDNLPGVWPLDYIMKAAELSMLPSGFTGGANAARNLVAALVNKTLDQLVVKEDANAPGTFVNKYGTSDFTTLYQDAFGLRAANQLVTYVTGKVTAYSTTDKTVTLDGTTTKTYVDSVFIQGKNTIADLKGQMVKLTLNKDGKAVFIQVTTPKEVVGDITAVDTVNLKVTVGGTAYTVNSNAEVYKNSALVQSTIAGALVAVNGTSAKLLLDSSGNVYRIEASVLDNTGTIAAKRTEIDSTGAAVNKMQVGSTWYNFKSTTTIVRNGASAVFADLAVGDDLKFSANGSDLIYVDAFNNVVKGYLVTGWVEDSSGKLITATKDGVSTTFTVNKNSDGTYSVTSVELNATYDFTLNRDGKVTAATKVTQSGPTTGEVKTISSKDLVYVSSTTKHRFTFSDGSTLILEDIPQRGTSVFASVYRNGVSKTASADGIWTAAKANDLFRIEKNGTGNGYDFFLFAPSVSGWVYHEANSPDFALVDTDGTTVLAGFTTQWSTSVTVNGVSVLNTKVDAKTTADGKFIGKVTFGGSNASGTTVPLAGSLSIEKFADATAYPVKGISSDADGYTFTLDTNSATALYVKTDKDTIVMKDGNKVTAADIKIGDKLLADQVYETEVAVADYVKASSDTTAPTVSNGTATWTDATHSLTVTFTTNEGCRKGYVWIGGAQKEATFTGSTWSYTTTDFTSKPDKVTIAAVDYAGNVASAVDVTVVVVTP